MPKEAKIRIAKLGKECVCPNAPQTEKPAEKTERQPVTSYFQNGQKCFYETFVRNSTAVILLNFSANNPPLRK
ncbi:MAG: hypothetical protein JSS64_03790 [Bacteroidetes bacterium]|nr:hypothetical protein [Bacteroidota bacterium]